MASKIEIGNLALQKLGQKRISSFEDSTSEARALRLRYPTALKAELEAHAWNFAIRRAQLASSATSPAFGPSNAFPVPADFLRIAPSDPLSNSNQIDFQIEGREILSSYSSPLNIRYVALVEDANFYTGTFIDAFATRLAADMCEELTQSTTKRTALRAEYKEQIREARKKNAFDNRPMMPAADDWETVRE